MGLRKIIIENPYNNRKLIKHHADKQQGVYVWRCHNKQSVYFYVGRSTNLYVRVRSYFLPSVLKRQDQRVIMYFNKYGFKNTVLILYINSRRDSESFSAYRAGASSNGRASLPNLNIELNARISRYNLPRDKDRRNFCPQRKSKRQKGKKIYVYNKARNQLFYIFDSKQDTYALMKIHRNTLCLNNSLPYLNYFVIESNDTDPCFCAAGKSQKRDNYHLNLSAFLKLVDPCFCAAGKRQKRCLF